MYKLASIHHLTVIVLLYLNINYAGKLGSFLGKGIQPKFYQQK